LAATWRRLLSEADASLGDRLEARRIVEHAGGLTAANLYACLDEIVPIVVAEQIRAMVVRRQSGEPLQHVLGRWGFRGLDIAVDGRALVPRPETELLVDHALVEWDRIATHDGAPCGGYAADLGTGSGVIALSLAAERELLEVFAVDRSRAALDLVRENLGALPAAARSRVHVLEGTWFSSLPPRLIGNLAIVVSNPPYLAADEWPILDPVVRDHDPHEALVAGVTGLEAIAQLVSEAPAWLAPGGALVVEIAPHQRAAVLALVAEAGRAYGSATVADDLAGRPRVLVARRAAR
jgi:release factor glutamine methyltransferase